MEDNGYQDLFKHLVERKRPQGPARCAVAACSEEPPPVSDMTDADLVELYQQICGRFAMYQTRVLFDRMFELRAEILRRLAACPNTKTTDAEATP